VIEQFGEFQNSSIKPFIIGIMMSKQGMIIIKQENYFRRIDRALFLCFSRPEKAGSENALALEKYQ
jgi:hypothetical protein